MKLKLNTSYKVFHDRKGAFGLQVLEQDEDFVTGIILKGNAKHISYEDALEGEKITIRKILATFVEMKGVSDDSKRNNK